MSTDQFIKLRDGRHMAVRRIRCVVPLADRPGWAVHMERDVAPGEIDAAAWPIRPPAQLIRARRGDVARDAAGALRQVVFWRVDGSGASPIFEG